MVEGPEQIPTKIEVGKPAAGDLIIGFPTTLPDSHYALIPVTLEHLKAWFESDPYYGYSASDYKRYDVDLNYYNPYARLHQELMVVSYRIHWHNVIFHNQQDHTTHTHF
jgi:hypothetical protein